MGVSRRRKIRSSTRRRRNGRCGAGGQRAGQWTIGTAGRPGLPRIGGAISKNDTAYKYLPESAAVFPSGPAFLEKMRGAGYRDVVWKPLTFGIAALYKGYV